MSNILIQIEKEELESMIQKAVVDAIQQLDVNKKQTEPESDIMNISETCRFLHMKKSTLYQKTHKNEIPFSKRGKALYFSKQELLNWLSEGRNLMEEDIQRSADLHLLLANKKRLSRKQ